MAPLLRHKSGFRLLYSAMMAHMNMTTRRQALAVLAILLTVRPSLAVTSDMDARLMTLEGRWAEIRYDMKDKAQKLAACRQLIAEAKGIVDDYPGKAAPLIWQAMALLAEAEVRNNLAALALVKDARRLLEHAEAIDPLALGGMIQTTLGMLYFETPGWPIAFGDKKKARIYLTRALEIDPLGKDSNYFFGDHLLMSGKPHEALPYLEKAAAAAPRAGHPRADAGRSQDVQDSLAEARRSLARTSR